MNGGWMKLHTGWAADGDLVSLMVDGRHDAVCLFFAAIAYAHSHETDGYLSDNDKIALVRQVVAREDAWDALSTLGKIHRAPGNSARKRWVIHNFSRWQTTREQREDNAERMRTSRARSTQRASKKERKEGTFALESDERAPHARDEEAFAVVSLDELTAEVIDHHPSLGAPFTDDERARGLANVKRLRPGAEYL